MTVKLKRSEINISLNSTEEKRIKAWTYNGLLAWHKDITGQWCLTHVPTGWGLMASCCHYKDIRPITRHLIEVIDWDSNDPTVIKDRLENGRKYERIVSIIRSYEYPDLKMYQPSSDDGDV